MTVAGAGLLSSSTSRPSLSATPAMAGLTKQLLESYATVLHMLNRNSMSLTLEFLRRAFTTGGEHGEGEQGQKKSSADGRGKVPSVLVFLKPSFDN